jgi:ATP-dependent DNA helicase DinG
MENNNGIDPALFLGPKGPIARQLSDYEERPEQIRLAQAIDESTSHKQHLIAEAGTGIGKSFAYIVPAVNWALQNKKKAVISTYTISLQEQLVQKDIPFIQDACEVKFSAALAKGRGNYICRRRLNHARRRGVTLFEDSNHINLLEELYLWSLETPDGSLSSMEQAPPRELWELICSDSNTCTGSHCPHFKTCFHQLARRRMFGCDLIIVNHALLFSDLAVRQQGGSILPKFNVVILDEAHNIEQVASAHFGLRLSNFQVNFLLNRMFNPKTEKGVLAAHRNKFNLKLIDKAHQAKESFFAEVLGFFDAQQSSGGGNRGTNQNSRQNAQQSNGNGRVFSPDAFANVLSGPLNELSTDMNELAKNTDDEQDRLEITSYAGRCREFAASAQLFVSQNLEDCVYWVEGSFRHQNRRAVACAAPLNIGPTLKKTLFDPCDSVVMTSATLSIQNRKVNDNKSNHTGFEFFTTRLGLEKFQTLQLGSPFNYPEQVKVYVEAYLPEARTQEQEFLTGATKAIKKYLSQTHGKAFILFTSFKQLHQMEQNLQKFCDQHELTLLAQGKGKDRSSLLEKFRRDTNSVLLGTDSFWQGVDVPGESLSNVIIVKLPFSVPDHPLLQARLEKIRDKGGSPFFDYQLPEAILKFKQGFGRLIRTQTDKGIVVILDSRVVTKNYGRAFLNVLPQCPTEIVKSPATTD